MNKEELLNKYIDLIDKGYCSDCNELNCIDNFPHEKITHAIRELQQEKQEWINLLDMFKTQQKEFINYMNDIIKELESEDADDEELRGYIIQRIYTFKEILQKYKSIIGGNDDKK